MSNAGAHIVIVGAGMAGASLALALREYGYSLTLLEGRGLGPEFQEQLSGLESYDNRVSAITPASQQFLADLGAWDRIRQRRCCPYQHMRVWDGEGTAEISFEAAEIGLAELGTIVENSVITNALHASIAACGGIELLDKVELTDIRRNEHFASVVQTADGREIQADLVVAADGAMSSVRRLAEFATREWDYGHYALVATVALAQSHRNTAWQCFTRSGPLAFLPLSSETDQHFASIVWSCDPDHAAELMDLDDEGFCAELGRAFEHRLGDVLAVSRRSGFPLRQRHAIDYVQPGIALVGDAAHTIHPLAGQGINLGFQDVSVLAEELEIARDRGIEPGNIAVLRRYQRRRKGDNMLMMAAMDGFKTLFAEQSPGVTLLRNTGMNWLQQLTPLKHRIMRHAMGLS